MTIDACASIVERGDPDRWRAVLAAPVAARPVLMPIYAANLEIARAPFAATEPMIAEMRLQWWIDALAEIGAGAPVRAHEVTTPLAEVLPPGAAAILAQSAEARRRDCRNEAFADADAFSAYLRDTGGAVMAAAALALGARDVEDHLRLGAATALAGWLLARPELAARGRDLSRDLPVSTLAAMAEKAVRTIRRSPARGPATLPACLAPPVLARAARAPAAIDEGRLAPSEFTRRLRLLKAGFFRS